MTPRATLAALAVWATLALRAGSAAAQNLEPRAYANTPVGMNFALAGYAFANGDVALDASVPLKNGKVEVNGAFLAYARSLDVFGKSAKVDVELPWAYTSGSAELNGVTESRHVNGLGDTRARFSINLYGAPALSLEQYPSYEQDLIIGASLQVTAPTGQYDPARLLNVGSHRWAFKPEIGISKSWSPFILEISAAGTFYTDNTDFFHGHDRAQNPIGSAQAHAIYSFKSGIWGSIDFTYYAGGKTLIDGTASQSLQSNTRLGGTLAIPVNRWNSIKLAGSTGVSARTGGKFDAIGFAWQVRWGGGL